MSFFQLHHCYDLVLAFTGAPATFPVQKENTVLHQYLVWSAKIDELANKFRKEVLPPGGFIGIHLRNGIDWVRIFFFFIFIYLCLILYDLQFFFCRFALVSTFHEVQFYSHPLSVLGTVRSTDLQHLIHVFLQTM